ncbi:MAG: Ig-like domain-containing protein [Mycobacteriales bacterium]|nr:Ig-like domain-containing protein [Mycobacteriales bacterium]
MLTDTRQASSTGVSAPSRLLAGSSALLVVDVTAQEPVTGTVRVQLDSPQEHGAVLAEGELDPGGRAMLTVVLPLGEHVLRVAYSGDARCAPSSCARVLRVEAHPTLVTLAGSRGPVPSGETVVLTARVSSSEESRAPSGTVLFLDGGRELGSARLGADGAAVLPVAALGTGVHRIVAAYSGDGSHAASRSTPIPQAVAVAAVQTRLALERVVIGQELGVTVTVVDAVTALPLPTASGEVVLSSSSSSLRVALLDGVARVRLPALGGEAWRVDYAGDAEHAACATVS